MISYRFLDFNTISKGQLGEILNDLARKVDTGNGSGADKELRDEALRVYIERFEKDLK